MVIRADEFWAATAALPHRPLEQILAPGGVLVLAPHPDDESLGCGGLIAAALAAGRRLGVVFLSDGAASHPGHPAAALRAMREAEARAALTRLGAPDGAARFLGLPDSRVPDRGAGTGLVVDADQGGAGQRRLVEDDDRPAPGPDGVNGGVTVRQ